MGFNYVKQHIQSSLASHLHPVSYPLSRHVTTPSPSRHNTFQHTLTSLPSPHLISQDLHHSRSLHHPHISLSHCPSRVTSHAHHSSSAPHIHPHPHTLTPTPHTHPLTPTLPTYSHPPFSPSHTQPPPHPPTLFHFMFEHCPKDGRATC